MVDKHTVSLSSSVEHAPDSSPGYSRTDIGPAQGEQKTSTGTTQGLTQISLDSNPHTSPSYMNTPTFHRHRHQQHLHHLAVPRSRRPTPSPPWISSRHRTRPHPCITALSRASSSSSFTPRLTMTARPSAVSCASGAHHVSRLP